jgi:hypothetical protein
VSGQHTPEHSPRRRIEAGSGARGDSAALALAETREPRQPCRGGNSARGALAAPAAVAARAPRTGGRRGTDRGVAKNVVALFLLPLACCST